MLTAIQVHGTGVGQDRTTLVVIQYVCGNFSSKAIVMLRVPGQRDNAWAKVTITLTLTLTLTLTHTLTLSHSHTLTLSHSHTLTLSHSHTPAGEEERQRLGQDPQRATGGQVPGHPPTAAVPTLHLKAKP